MQEFSHGEIGWDVFTLEYKVDPPVDVVLDSASMEVYTRLFSHLFRIKRLEYTLNQTWKRVTNEARWYKRVVEVSQDLHQVRIALAEMVHFVKQLYYFCHLEVIDCSWTVLEEFAQRKEGDLDALISAHQAYVDRLASKALLRGSGPKADDAIFKQVREAFKVILHFKENVDALCNYALAEASRQESALDELRGIRAPSRAGSSSSNAGTPIPQLAEPDPEVLAGIRRRLGRNAALFSEQVMSIVTALASHSDLDLRFLSCRLNFSLYYLVGRKKA